MDQEVASDSWTCGGCGGEITEGQHFMTMRIELDTHMPPDWRPSVDVPKSTIEARVHNPNCGVLWQAESELLKNVFD